MMARFGWVIHIVVMGIAFAGIALSTRSFVSSAVERLKTGAKNPLPVEKAPLVVSTAEDSYCTPELKAVLRRVLTSCGLIGGGRRGCQPDEVRTVAQISDADFNALFRPLAKRGGVVLFDVGKEDLDEGAKALIERMWADRRGASYFFVVARASTDGPTVKNRILSHKRANSVLFHLQERFQDPDIEKQVGLMWLGEEFAQLGREFCDWELSRPKADCREEVINRSAILSWIDCRL